VRYVRCTRGKVQVNESRFVLCRLVDETIDKPPWSLIRSHCRRRYTMQMFSYDGCDEASTDDRHKYAS
jgi:hypothetical protein